MVFEESDQPPRRLNLPSLQFAVSGYWSSFALVAAIEKSLFDAIYNHNVPVSIQFIANVLCVPEAIATCLTSYFAELGILQKADGQWLLTFESRELLCKKGSRYVGDWLLSMAAKEAFQEWTQAFFSETGVSYSSLADDTARASAREQIGTLLAGKLCRVLRKRQLISKNATIADLGCGHGAYSLRLATTFPTVRIVALDIDSPTLEKLAKASPGNLRTQYFDAFRSHLSFKVDAFLMSNLLHEYSDLECVRLLRKLKNQLCDSGKLLLHHDFINSDNTLSRQFAHLASCHLAISGATGRLRTFSEIQELVVSSGFRVALCEVIDSMELIVCE